MDAAWRLLSDGSAVMEMARPAARPYVPEGRKDPRNATSPGIGEMIADIRAWVRRILIGIGGSAANDGGMLKALGVRFTDADGKSVAPVGGAMHNCLCVFNPAPIS